MEDFDPYQQWFDIESDGHPIDHYQLLGLKRFESSVTEIENAVASRAEFLQALSMGQYVHQAQRILNEVARARICLINSDRKSAYDAKLQEYDSQAISAQPVPMAIPLESPVDDASALRELQLALEGRKASTTPKHKDKSIDPASRNHKKLWAALVGVLLVGVIVAATIFFNQGDSEHATQSGSANKNLAIDKPNQVVAKTQSVAKKTRSETKPKPKPKAKASIPESKKPKPLAADENKTNSGKAPDRSPKANPKNEGKPKVAKPPVAKKAPPVVLPKFPLKFFPDQVELPGVADSSTIKIGDLFVPPEAKLSAQLVYLPAWSGGTTKYKIRPDNASKRRWIVSGHSLKGQSVVDVAQISLDGYALNFQWLDSAKDQMDANYLRNGVLELSIYDNQSKRVSLQTGIQLGQLKIVEKDLSGRIRQKLDTLPNVKSLNFRLIPLPKWQLECNTYCEPNAATAKEPLKMYFSKNPLERFFWLEVNPTIRDGTIVLEAELKIVIGTTTKTVKSTDDLQDVIGLLNAASAQLKKQSEAKQIPKNLKDQLVAEIKKIAQQITVCQRYKNQVIPKLLQRNISVRAFYRLGDQQIVVARTGGREFSSRRFVERIEEFKDYQLVYDLDLKNLAAKIKYDVDLSSTIGEFDRIGYLMELKKQKNQTVFVSMKAFTNDIKLIGVPTTEKSVFQRPVDSMNVYSNDKLIPGGLGLTTGYLEFWPNKYTAQNEKKIEGASDKDYDFSDKRTPGKNQYGSMQIHDLDAKQTIFALNHWDQGEKADLGIGNAPDKNPDWTFRANAKDYSLRRLRIYVRPKIKLAN